MYVTTILQSGGTYKMVQRTQKTAHDKNTITITFSKEQQGKAHYAILVEHCHCLACDICFHLQ